jgi:hypothetical protein
VQELTELLGTLNADVLNALAGRLGVSNGVRRKAEVINQLTTYLNNNLRDLVSRISEAERKLLAEAAYHGGEVDKAGFEAKYGAPCPMPSPSSYRRSDHSLLLLLFGGGYGERRVPEPLAARLRTILDAPAQATVQTVETPPSMYVPPKERWREPDQRPVRIHEGENIVFPELRAVLKLAQAGKLKVTDQTGRPTEATVRLISEVLVVPDFGVDAPPEKCDKWTEQGGAIRAHAWGVLVQQCAWTKARGGRLVLTTEGQALLASMSPAGFRAGVDHFIVDERFDELNRVNHIRGQSGRGKRYLTSPGERRLAIWESMPEWPMNRWVDFDEAVRFLLAGGHRFRVTEESSTLYFSELQYGHLGGQGGEISRQYMRAFLFESLATLGLVDVAYAYPHHLWPDLGQSWGIDDMSFCSRYDGLLYVRLNALGAYCTRARDAYEPCVAPAAAAFRVLPNLEITLLEPLSSADRHMLAMCAAEKSEFVWEVDAGLILNHLEAGGATEDVLQYLETHSSSPVPQTVRTRILDLGKRAAAVRGVEEALLVEFSSETDAALIAHDSDGRKYCRLAGGKHLAVPKRNYRAFRTALRKLGFIIPDASASA